MKIAVITEDGATVSQHFGRAPYYMVFTVENEEITGKEQREKFYHNHFVLQESSHGGHEGPHGFDSAAQHRHGSMAETISDCQVLIAGGMGMGAYQSLLGYNIKPVVTDVKNIQDAVKLQIEGNLPNLRERLH